MFFRYPVLPEWAKSAKENLRKKICRMKKAASSLYSLQKSDKELHHVYHPANALL